MILAVRCFLKKTADFTVGTYLPVLRLKAAGIGLEEKDWEFEIDAYGKVTVSGDLSEEEKRQTEKILEEEFEDQLWDALSSVIRMR